MKILKSKILYIGESEKEYNRISSIIKNPWNQVFWANNFESAMKESIMKSLDLIICCEKLEEMDGFQVYTILNNEILKNYHIAINK